MSETTTRADVAMQECSDDDRESAARLYLACAKALEEFEICARGIAKIYPSRDQRPVTVAQDRTAEARMWLDRFMGERPEGPRWIWPFLAERERTRADRLAPLIRQCAKCKAVIPHGYGLVVPRLCLRCSSRAASKS